MCLSLKPAIFLMCRLDGHDVQYLNRLFPLINPIENGITSADVHSEKVITWEMQLFLVRSSRIRILFQHVKPSFYQLFTLFGPCAKVV